MAVILTVCMLPMTGCNKNKISIGLDTFPSTLDPQLEAHQSGASVFSFLFSGLLQYGKDGMLRPDVAEQFFFSQDESALGTESGGKLTFILRTDRFWQDGSQVTSYDFEFAIERVLTSETGSPYAKVLFSIAGAEAFYNKTAAQVSGISCPDKSTLIFSLDYTDEMFLYAFAEPWLSPCNKTFFTDAGGSYGITAAKTLLNGPYTVYSRNDAQIVLEKFDNAEKTLPDSVTFFKSSSVSEKELAARIKSKKTVMAISDRELDIGADIETERIDDLTWAVCFGTGVNKAGRDELFRLALAYGGFGELQQQNKVTNLMPAAYSNFFLSKPQPARASDNEAAKGFLSALLTNYKLSSLPTITLLVPDEEEARSLSDQLVQLWQKNISVFVTREYYSRSKIQSMMKNGDYDAALIPVEYTQSTPFAFYKDLCAQIGPFETVTAQLDTIQAYSEQEFAKAAEQLLFDSRRIFPIQKGCIFIYSDPDLSHIYYNRRAGIVDLE